MRKRGTMVLVSTSDNKPAGEPLGVLTVRRKAPQPTFAVRFEFNDLATPA